MPDFATPNLPSRDFDATEAFYSKLGFERRYRGPGWMILHRAQRKDEREGSGVMLEFFPYPDLDPASSSFSCCIRLDNLPDIMAQLEQSDIPLKHAGIPRYRAAQREPSGMTIGYLNDLDGSLIRLVQND